MKQNVYFALHNAHSRSIIVQFVQTVLGFGFKNIIISKATGSAATSGIPEAFRLAFPQNANMLVTSNIQEAIDLIRPQDTYLIISKKYASEALNMQEVKQSLEQGKKELFVLGGSSPGLSRKELELGAPRHVTTASEEIAPTAYLGILLDKLTSLG